MATETHRGGQLSPIAAALASALSHGSATVDEGVQVGALAPVDGTEYFRMSEDGSDVQEQVTEQETPDVCVYERVQQCADDERAHTSLAPFGRVSESIVDADLGVQVETPFPHGQVQQSIAQVPVSMLVSFSSRSGVSCRGSCRGAFVSCSCAAYGFTVGRCAQDQALAARAPVVRSLVTRMRIMLSFTLIVARWASPGCSYTDGIARFVFDCGMREGTRLMAISWLVWTRSRATS